MQLLFDRHHARTHARTHSLTHSQTQSRNDQTTATNGADLPVVEHASVQSDHHNMVHPKHNLPPPTRSALRRWRAFGFGGQNSTRCRSLNTMRCTRISGASLSVVAGVCCRSDERGSIALPFANVDTTLARKKSQPTPNTLRCSIFVVRIFGAAGAIVACCPRHTSRSRVRSRSRSPSLTPPCFWTRSCLRACGRQVDSRGVVRGGASPLVPRSA